MQKAAILAILLASLTMTPALAFAQQGQQVQCAVGYTGGAERVVLTFGAYNTQTLVDQDASACTDLISTGQWVGADKYADWHTRGYQLLCQIWFSPTSSADVYAQPFIADRTVGYQTCTDGENARELVTYTNVGAAQDLP
jgi:hypothetical protein